MSFGKCDSCGAIDVELTQHAIYSKDDGRKLTEIAACTVCVGSGIAGYYFAARQPTPLDLARMVAFCTNEIIREVRRAPS